MITSLRQTLLSKNPNKKVVIKEFRKYGQNYIKINTI